MLVRGSLPLRGRLTEWRPLLTSRDAQSSTLTPDTRDLGRRGLRLGAGGLGFIEGGVLGSDTLHRRTQGWMDIELPGFCSAPPPPPAPAPPLGNPTYERTQGPSFPLPRRGARLVAAASVQRRLCAGLVRSQGEDLNVAEVNFPSPPCKKSDPTASHPCNLQCKIPCPELRAEEPSCCHVKGRWRLGRLC